MKEVEKKSLVEKAFLKANMIDKVLENKVDVILLKIINMLKYIFTQLSHIKPNCFLV